MERVEVTTVVYASRERVYDFLLDFPGYADYSEYLRAVRQRGDGGPGTTYDLRFAWWKITYTARSEVTDVDPPERIDWRITKDIDATGRWLVERVDDGETVESSRSNDEPSKANEESSKANAESITEGEAPADEPATEPATRVRFVVEYDPGSKDVSGIDLPRFVSLGWVIEKVKPKIESEATRIVERVVADLEGRQRDVDLTVETGRSRDD